jgi:hypothetical protein
VENDTGIWEVPIIMQNLNPVRIILFCTLLCVIGGCYTTHGGKNWLDISGAFPDMDILRGVIIAEWVMGLIVYDLYIEYCISIGREDDSGIGGKDIPLTSQLIAKDILMSVERDGEYVLMHMDTLSLFIDSSTIMVRNMGIDCKLRVDRYRSTFTINSDSALTIIRNDLDSARSILTRNSKSGEYKIHAYYNPRLITCNGEFLRLPDSISKCVCELYQVGDSVFVNDTTFNIECDEILERIDNYF